MKPLNKLFIILIIFFSSLTAITNTYATNDFAMTYKNQRGSVITLNFHPDTTNNAGTLDGSVLLISQQEAFPLFGYYNGNAMAVAIHFSHSKQVTAMIGHLLDNKNKIQTLSLDALQTKDSHTEDWNSTIVRVGSYTRL